MADEELAELRALARREGLTLSEWVRRALRRARDERPTEDRARKLAAVRAASRHAFPTADIERMLEEIETRVPVIPSTATSRSVGPGAIQPAFEAILGVVDEVFPVGMAEVMRGGLRLQADPGSVSVGASLGAGAAGPLSVSVVRTTTGASTRLGRPGAYLETELALSSPRGTLSGSARVRVDLAPRPSSLGDVARVGTLVVAGGRSSGRPSSGSPAWWPRNSRLRVPCDGDARPFRTRA